MSSTNRSNVRELHRSDYYVTPTEQIVKFLNDFRKYEDIFVKSNVKVLDCCAGGDLKHLMSYPEALKQIGIYNVDTIDIREDSLADIKTDYLTFGCKNKYDVIITNPPFNIAESIIKKAIDDVRDCGWVIMLLRLNYFGSELRQNTWREIFPSYTFVDYKRMSFTDDKKTDSIEYAHFCFKKGYKPEFSLLKVI